MNERTDFSLWFLKELAKQQNSQYLKRQQMALHIESVFGSKEAISFKVLSDQ